MFNIGTQELLIILFVVLMLFGAKRIPEVARSLGKGIGDFRDALSGVERELKGETPARPRPAEGAVPRVGPSADPTPAPLGPPDGGSGQSPAGRRPEDAVPAAGGVDAPSEVPPTASGPGLAG